MWHLFNQNILRTLSSVHLSWQAHDQNERTRPLFSEGGPFLCDFLNGKFMWSMLLVNYIRHFLIQKVEHCHKTYDIELVNSVTPKKKVMLTFYSPPFSLCLLSLFFSYVAFCQFSFFEFHSNLKRTSLSVLLYYSSSCWIRFLPVQVVQTKKKKYIRGCIPKNWLKVWHHPVVSYSRLCSISFHYLSSPTHSYLQWLLFTVQGATYWSQT